MRPDDWTTELLEGCSTGELEALAQLLGVAKAGTKAEKIARLIDLGQLRGTLSAFDDPDVMVATFKRRELYAMAKRAGCYLGGAKRLLACALLTWRNECRRRGQAARAEAREAAKAEPRQLRFRF